MKPLNFDNSPCSPISSNCVIWQGPDMPCIKLCTGDTVSDVVAKLASELCVILDEIKVSNYDLSCFGIINCKPDSFQALIQFLIDQICSINNINSNAGTGTTPSKESTLVTVAPCFVVNGVTVLPLVDYVQLIANKVCSILDQIDIINNQIINIDNRVTVLENTPPPTFTLPNIPTNCLASYMGGAGAAPIDQVLDTLINNDTIGYCALIEVTGMPTDLSNAVLSQCITSTDPSYQSIIDGDSPVQSMSQKYLGFWVDSPATVADAINNLWIAICDMRSLLLTVQDTTTVNLTYTGGVLSADVQDTGWIDLLGFDFSSAYNRRPQCRRIGNVIHFRGLVTIPLGDANSGAGGTAIDQPNVFTYHSIHYGKTYNTVNSGNGADSCLLYTHSGALWTPGDLALFLRFNLGNSVIPSGILNPGQSLDGTYSVGTKQVIVRIIDTSNLKRVPIYSIVSIAVEPTGKLILATAINEEVYTTSTSGYEYSAIGRNLISNIVAGENVPLFPPTAPSEFNAAAVGAYSPNLTGIIDTWLFSQNAGRADELGGFQVAIDGLSAFISPCGPRIPTPTPVGIGC